MGKLYAISTDESRYIYEGEFAEDKPVHFPNQMLFYQEPVEEEEDPKQKKDAKKGEEEDENPYKIVYEIGKSQPISFEIKLVFQGEPYEDDTPLDEEELKKQAAKKGKGGDEAEVRMITPDPVIITHESGRYIEFEMGRMELPVREETEENEDQPPPEEQLVLYQFDQRTDSVKSCIDSEEGIIKIEGLTYELKDGLKGGTYDITVRDITNKIQDHLPQIKITLEIIDPEEPPVPAKGKKK